MTTKDRSDSARLAANARAAKLSPERRSEIARLAAQARHAGK
jgi:hypothetical protein